MTEKDELVQRAKLAEQAERWEAYIEQFEGIAPATMWLVLVFVTNLWDCDKYRTCE